MRQEREDYVEWKWKRAHAEKADALTRRAATRAKQLLNLMIQLGHYDPERHNVNVTQRQMMERIKSCRYLMWIGVNPGCVQTVTPTLR